METSIILERSTDQTIAVAIELMQQICLSDEVVKPSQAADLVRSWSDRMINVHNIQKLSMWVGNEQADTGPVDEKMEQLQIARKEIRTLVAEAKKKDRKCKVRLNLELTMTK